MPNPSFSCRLGDDIVDEIRKRFPEFGTAENGKAGTSNVLRQLIEQGLKDDPEQARQSELANVKEQLRDLKEDLKSIRRNFSTVLQVVLRNAGKFDPAEVEATIQKLKEGGKIV